MTGPLLDQLKAAFYSKDIVIPNPDHLPPDQDAAEAMRDALLPVLGEIGAFKLGATIAAVRANLGLGRQFFAAIPNTRIFADGEAVPVDAARQTGVESEYAFVFGRDLTLVDAALSADELLALVVSVHPAIEIPGSRFAVLAGHGGPALVADAGATGALVVGAGQAFKDFAALTDAPVRLEIEGEEPVLGGGAVIDGGPAGPLLAFVKTALARGYQIRAGQPIVTGSCTGYVVVPRGKQITAHFPALNSEISTSFVIEP